MKPYIHAKNSVVKYGGKTSDYIDIHDFMDSSKSSIPDHRHRAILHSSFGVFIAERVFGHVRTNSDGKEYSVRDVAEDHVHEDLGFIPTVENWLDNLPIEDWMGGSERGNANPKIPVKTRPINTPPLPNLVPIDWDKKNPYTYDPNPMVPGRTYTID